jgi:uncharacterized protein (TIGR02271 family)
MTSTFDPQTLIGKTAVDNSGDKIGKIGQVYLDDRTGEPAWVTVSTGLFGTRESFAPLDGAQVTGDDTVQLSVTKEQIKDAPNVSDDGHIGDDEQAELYRYYSQFGIGTGAYTDELAGKSTAGTTTGTMPETGYADPAVSGTRSYRDTGDTGTTRDTDSTMNASAADFTDADAGYTNTGYAGRGGEVGGPGHDVSGPNTDDAMTRSEEQLHVGTENVESGRARLRKYVVTENVQQTVPVSHEEVRIEREPITDANVGAATDGPAISEEEHEVTLHAERPVVQKEAVPVERVRVGTETVTDQAQVNEDVRKEQIDVDGNGINDTRTS